MTKLQAYKTINDLNWIKYFLCNRYQIPVYMNQTILLSISHGLLLATYKAVGLQCFDIVGWATGRASGL